MTVRSSLALQLNKVSRISLVGAFAITGSFSVMGASTGRLSTPRAASPWHVLPQTERWGVGFQAFACSSQLQCVMMVRSKGLVATAVQLDGAGIKAESSVKTTPAPENELSCASLRNCQGVHYFGTILQSTFRTSIYRTTDGGAHWKVDVMPSALRIVNVSCMTSSHCMAIGRMGPLSDPALPILAYVTTNSGGKWSEAKAPPLPAAADVLNRPPLSCASDGVCLVANGHAGPNRLEMTDNSGKTWTHVTLPSNQAIESVSCSGTTYCHVLTDHASRALLWVVRQHGAPTPTAHALPGVTSQLSYSMSCPTSTACYFGATRPPYRPVAYLTSNNGAAWTVEFLPPALSGAPDVECGPGGHCIARTVNVLAVRT